MVAENMKSERSPVVTEARAVGRPTTYSEEIALAICEKVANGQGMREICRADDMPAMSTVFLWLKNHGDFQSFYTTAKDTMAEYLFEEMLDIADEASNDFMTRKVGDDKTEKVVDHEHINRSKLRVDTRKWMLAKLLPKKYGEKIEVNNRMTFGPDVERMTPDELRAFVARETEELGLGNGALTLAGRSDAA